MHSLNYLNEQKQNEKKRKKIKHKKRTQQTNK